VISLAYFIGLFLLAIGSGCMAYEPSYQNGNICFGLALGILGFGTIIYAGVIGIYRDANK